MLIRTVEKFLRENDMAATKFGRLAAHDPRFVLDLRMGRIPRSGTEKRVRQWMEDYAPDHVPPAYDATTAGKRGYEVKGYAPRALQHGGYAHAY